MKWNPSPLALMGLLALLSCRGVLEERADAGGDPHHQDSATYTRMARGIELYAEAPPEGAGKWLLYLTRIETSKPVDAEYCRAGEARGGAIQPGIVRIDEAPASVEEIECAINGEVFVFDLRGGPDRIEGAAVRFLKEQQWTLPFQTALPERRSLHESLRIPAEFRARPGALADVSAPLAGRVEMEGSAVVGATVSRGEAVAAVLPPTPAAADLASLELASQEAEAARDLARRELERAERLVEAGAAPAKRLEEARAGLRGAEARVAAAEMRIRQYESSRDADGREVGARRFLVRAPIGGTIVEVNVPAGAYVETGKTLVRIADTAVLHVHGFVPESAIPRLAEVTRADVELSDGQVIAAGRRVSVGRLLDQSSRTLPVVYEVRNPLSRLAIYQAAYLRLWFRDAREVLALPEAAIVDEGPQQVIYVQRSGESFLRRVVEPGLRAGGWVEIVSGLRSTDRVVVKGAYLLKLAGTASEVPAEGHVH
jgi:cobalt-zinc-cadmium efflux system membrane fusion protein